MHKEAQQAVGGPTSLRANIKEGAHPQLSSGCDASQQDLMQDTRLAFLTTDFPQDKPNIVLDESKEENTKRYEDTHTTSHDGPEDTTSLHPPSPKSIQVQELMTRLLTNRTKRAPLKNHKIIYFENLKKHVQDIEIELPGDLKEIPKKLETFTSTISSNTSLVVELKTIQWDLPTEFLVFPNQISSVKEKQKTLDALTSLLNKVTVTLNRFASLIIPSSQHAKDKGILSVSKSYASPAEGEKNKYLATKEANMNNDLVYLMGINVVEEYHKKKFASLIISSSQHAKDKGILSASKSYASPAEGEKNKYLATKEANMNNDLVYL
nr:hypothetical protein [Tanacetum cinerariifolium]